MDDEKVFGVELYRKSYSDAVENGWLSDYRIIAIGVNDKKAYQTANALAAESSTKKLSTVHFLKGLILALVMSGKTQDKEGGAGTRPIMSSINFMNEIAKSKEMVKALNSEVVQVWLRDKLNGKDIGQPAKCKFEHLDAKSNVATRESAKARLAAASADNPHGVINVGIFGEGVDAPSLSAVGFLEPRRSPVDVIQAVGRVMRRSPGKDMGYIICPILIPPDQDAENWLKISGPDDGWRELGEILVALRAHDSRIEDELAHLMHIYLPPKSENDVSTMVALGNKDQTVEYHGHVGKPGKAIEDVNNVLKGTVDSEDVFCPLPDILPDEEPEEHISHDPNDPKPANIPRTIPAPDTIVSGKRNKDGSNELRQGVIIRDAVKPNGKNGVSGKINVPKSKEKGRDMVNGKSGTNMDHKAKRKRGNDQVETDTIDLFEKLEEAGLKEISVNLLSKSGLSKNRIERDVNIIRESIAEARHHLSQDELDSILDEHFGLDKLDPKKRADQADGCTIASLLLMNACMLHQRIASGKWLNKVHGLDQEKNSPNAVLELRNQWNRITRHDFLPVMEPALEIIEVIERTGRKEGLERTLRHLSGEAVRVAESYADLGADHAGPLFNRVMGNQDSDGAYFTRPVAASLLARIALDALDDVENWTHEQTWEQMRIVDPACGSGTILAAMLTEMKRRARESGASKKTLAKMQKLSVEQVLSGLDINEISLQLAAAQLTSGNSDVTYRKMGLHKLLYGLDDESIKVGSLELLGQKNIVPDRQQDLWEQDIKSKRLQMDNDSPLLEDAVDAVRGARVIVMNPPFTNRTKMGEKFTKDIQKSMRKRADYFDRLVSTNDPPMKGFADKNSIRPLFVALAERCLDPDQGLLAMINPTIALTAPSGLQERIVLAERFHIHSLISCHLPGQVSLSQNTGINETIIIAKRCKHTKPPTRIINLDRFPKDEQEVGDLHNCITNCARSGLLDNGWGEVSEWPADRVQKGDWTAAVMRSTKLAEIAAEIVSNGNLFTLEDQGMIVMTTKEPLYHGFVRVQPESEQSFPVVASKGADGQLCIMAEPDEFWAPKLDASVNQQDMAEIGENTRNSKVKSILNKAGYLLITCGQNTQTARLTCVVADTKAVGTGWTPVSNLSFDQAKAIAVFLNSTAGRCQFMRSPGMTLAFPNYNPVMIKNLKVPDISNKDVLRSLEEAWEKTQNMKVPQYREGECKVREIWDDAVSSALGWERDKLIQWRHLLHKEPHVCGLGYNEYR